jgi:hypothetical protein
MMNRRDEKAAEEELAEESSMDSPAEPPIAYIPACGTLCDAFWWARRSSNREGSSD